MADDEKEIQSADAISETAPVVDPETIDVSQAEPEVHVNVFINAIKQGDPGLIKEWAQNVVTTPKFWIYDVGLIALALLIGWIVTPAVYEGFCRRQTADSG